MIVKTLFFQDGRYEAGEVEVKLMPGVPALHVVGLPDSHIREIGVRLKSALRSAGLVWPQGHQIVVNLRPSYLRKSSSGADLAIALGFLNVTNQISEETRALVNEGLIYGEVALDGRVFAPKDFAMALRRAGSQQVLTGVVSDNVWEGKWWTLQSLGELEKLEKVERQFSWENFWQPPPLPDIQVHPRAAQSLALAVHLHLGVLVAGPQGSGKSTWARALHALTSPPDPVEISELRSMFGDRVLEGRWRPLESPHHSITPKAMIGGGVPLRPGAISHAHGGILLMDEFLEFNSEVLEALREPVERGYVEHVRKGEWAKYSARFQLIATTNLCPCGALNPGKPRSCPQSLIRCRSVCQRLSGPMMDRFDWLLLSHMWLDRGERVPLTKVRETVKELEEFAVERGEREDRLPDWVHELQLSHRRQRSLLRVARGLADLEKSHKITSTHFTEAYDLVVKPMQSLLQLFA